MTQHRLREVRIGYGLTVQDLADLSGICTTTIHRIESGSSDYKIHEATAKAIADALYEQTVAIFSLTELSHLGRTPKTGAPIKQQDVVTLPGEVCCGSCFTLMRPVDNYCINCEAPILRSAG